jgi:aspartate/methionine/tyrosine aminotransferase
LIILTGITVGFTSTWWRQGWLLAALAMMLVIWIVMKRVSNIYLYAVDAIAERALNNREDASAIDKFKSELKARREPEILNVTSALGGLISLSLMMFEPF